MFTIDLAIQLVPQCVHVTYFNLNECKKKLIAFGN